MVFALVRVFRWIGDTFVIDSVGKKTNPSSRGLSRCDRTMEKPMPQRNRATLARHAMSFQARRIHVSHAPERLPGLPGAGRVAHVPSCEREWTKDATSDPENIAGTIIDRDDDLSPQLQSTPAGRASALELADVTDAGLMSRSMARRRT